MQRPRTIQYGANFNVVGKTDEQKLSYAGAWEIVEGTAADLAEHIIKGYPWMPALVDEGQPRKQHYSNLAYVLGVDVDGGMTLEEAKNHPFIRKYAALIIESASSTPEHNKFRIVFVLPRPVEGWQNVRLCNEYLAQILDCADKKCKDASRYFFGAPGRSPVLLDESATLPEAFIEDVKAWNDEREAESRRQAEEDRKRWENWRAANPKADPNELILVALYFIDPDEDYNYWLSVGATLKALGFPVHVFESWSAQGQKYRPGECERKWNSFRNPEPRIGHLFNLAKRGGFQFPKRGQSATKAKPIPRGIPAMAAGLRDRKPKPAVGFAVPKPDDKDIYTFRDAEEAISFARQRGLDTAIQVDGTGVGKTHAAGLLHPETMGCDRAIALLPDPLNPPTDSFCDWELLSGANYGTVLDGEKLRRADRNTPESQKIEPANCVNVGARLELEKRNPRNSAYDLACLNCHQFKACQHVEGMLRADTRRVMAKPRIRMAYGRVSAEIAKDGALIADELSKNLESEKNHFVSVQDIARTIARLEGSENEALRAIAPRMRVLIDGSLNYLAERRGKRIFEIPLVRFKDMLLEMFNGVDVEALERFEDGSEEMRLFGVDRRGVALSDNEKADLQRLKEKYVGTPEQYQEMQILSTLKVRKAAQRNRLRLYKKNLLTHEDAARRDELQARADASQGQEIYPAQLEALAQDLSNRWLADTLRVLRGEASGHLSLSTEGLTLTTRTGRQLEAIAAAKFVFVTDGSLAYKSDAEISKRIGRSRILRFRIKAHAPVTNVKRVQITGLGKLGKSRGEGRDLAKDGAVAKLREIHSKLALFDYKNFNHDGKLFLDNVGSNDYQDCDAIATVVPSPNIGAILAQYCTRFNASVDIDDPDFQEYYERVRFDALRETEGRLRANMRPGQKLTFYILSDGEVPYPVDEVLDVYDIDPDLARAGDRTARNLAEVAHKLGMVPQKINQSALARAFGVTQQYVSKVVEQVKSHLQLILYGLYRNGCRCSKWQLEKAKALAQTISEVAKLGDHTLLTEAIEWMDSKEWAIAFQYLSDDGQKMVLQNWISLLSPSEGEVTA